MNRLIAWFAGNGVAANTVLVLVVAGGLITLPGIKRELFPEFIQDRISIAVAYPGATPTDVEEGILVRIEEALVDLDDVDEIRSVASQGAGRVLLRVRPGEETTAVLDEVKARVDAIATFPEEAERPLIEEVDGRDFIIGVAISSETADRAALRTLAERVRDELVDLDGVSQVSLYNAPPYEIAIEVDEAALERYGLTFDQLATALRRRSLDLPGGSIKTSSGEVLLRTAGQLEAGERFAELEILSRPDGTALTLGDVAHVNDGFAETDLDARFDGRPAVFAQVFRVGDESALEVSAAVHRYVDGLAGRLPEGVHADTWLDAAVYLRGRIDLLLHNGRTGLVLVFVTLALFLRFQVAFWVTAGIPISFLGTIWLMPWLDMSFNMISLFAFILVLGIVVDDAIVVGESVFTTERRRGHGGRPSLDDTIRGAQQVAIPVIFAVLTTVVTFVPMLLIPGAMGRVWRVIPVIVIPTLLFSLVESQLVLPAHLAHGSLRLPWLERASGAWTRFQGRFADGLEHVVARWYGPLLERALGARVVVIAAFLAVTMLTAGLVASGRVRFVFFPRVDGDQVVAALSFPLGTPIEVTRRGIARIERDALALARDEPASVRHVGTSIGEQPFGANVVQGPRSGSHVGEVTLELTPTETRRHSAEEIGRRLRERIGTIPGAERLSVIYSDVSAGEPIHVQLAGLDLPDLEQAAHELEEGLGELAGVYDVATSLDVAKPEVRLAMTPEGEAYGIALADLARQVRQAFYGEEVQRVQRGRDEVKVMLRYPERARRSLDDLERMRVRLEDGTAVPLTSVAAIEQATSPATILRVDRRRTVSVTADVDLAVSTANEVVSALATGALADLRTSHPHVSVGFEGEQREQAESLDALFRGFVLALLAIYALLAIPFRSYLQPVVVMAVIPFGLVGATWGHILMGMDLSVLSLCGAVALTGVVVNDSLVLVDYVNGRRAGGEDLGVALRAAGMARFRPILLTSLTTFLGLTPMLLERSVQATFLNPMAVSLAFGVLFATVLTLFLVPVGYSLVEEGKARVATWLGAVEDEVP